MALYNFSILRLNQQIAEEQEYCGIVVDMGCGTAPYKKIILRSADQYVGVDWSNSPHDTNEVDVVADLNKPVPIEDHFADTVVSFQVMEHLSEPAQFVGECFRILKPGGRIIITTPFMWGVHEAPFDFFRYTRHGLTYLLEQAGFSDIEIAENTGFWQTFALRLNYNSLKFARGPLRYLFAPFWWLDQKLAVVMDRLVKSPEETASYTTTATRPPVADQKRDVENSSQ